MFSMAATGSRRRGARDARRETGCGEGDTRSIARRTSERRAAREGLVVAGGGWWEGVGSGGCICARGARVEERVGSRSQEVGRDGVGWLAGSSRAVGGGAAGAAERLR